MKRRYYRLARKDFPAELQVPYIKGVYVGGCIERGRGSSFRSSAHGHTAGPFDGWICVRAEKHLADRILMLHERAHVATGEGHTDAWRRELLRIGGSLDVGVTGGNVSYHKMTITRLDGVSMRDGVKFYGRFVEPHHHPKCPCLERFRAAAHERLSV